MMPQALLRAQMTRGLKHLVFGAINAQIGMGWACLEQKQAEQTGFGFSLNDNDNQVLLVPKVKQGSYPVFNELCITVLNRKKKNEMQ